MGCVILEGISINCKCSSCSPGRPSCYIAHLLSHGRRHVRGHLDGKSREERKVPKLKFTLKISKSLVLFALCTPSVHLVLFTTIHFRLNFNLTSKSSKNRPQHKQQERSALPVFPFPKF